MFTAAGKSAAASSAVYVEDVFSTWLYTGNGSARNIQNGISFGTTGGLIGGSVSFDGSGDYMEVADQSLFNLGNSAYTIEFFVYPTSFSSSCVPLAYQWSNSGGTRLIAFIQNTDATYTVYFNNAGNVFTSTNTVTLNQWNHIALVRSSNTFTLYINGTSGASAVAAITYSDSSFPIVIGASYDNSGAGVNSYFGSISNLRVATGNAVYTANFVPPTAPLTAVAGTRLLTCQTPNPVLDYSGNNFPITVVGAVAQTTGGPFTEFTQNKPGMVWFKSRSAATNNQLFDSVRGPALGLSSNSDAAQTTETTGLTSFNSNGFTIGSSSTINQLTATYASWTFLKQAKFFDVVTYTGNGVSNRTIAHNLGSVPGCIIVKRLSGASDGWAVWHRGLSANNVVELNLAAAQTALYTTWFGSNLPTSTVFNLGTDTRTNGNGSTYVAYLFAHDAGGFGLTGADNVITCGSVVGSGTTSVTLGYEPQWILMKNASAAQDWWLVDNMRGLPAPSANARLLIPNKTDAEAALSVNINATGFTTAAFSSGQTYIYIAIRRGPMKTPTSGTTVYSPVARTGTGAAASITSVQFPPDWVMFGPRSIADNKYEIDRLRGAAEGLITNSNNIGVALGSLLTLNMNGISFSDGNSAWNQNAATYVNWFFGRAPGFLDIVCYTGTGSTRTVAHNLGVAPELVLYKARDFTADWVVYAQPITASNFLSLNTTAAQNSSVASLWNGIAPTSTNLTVVSNNGINGSGLNYVAYLFASCPGVSKVGSYTGTGALQTVNCGFAAGARYVLIKRTDSTGAWYVYDSARGISSGNDPYLLLNSNVAEVANTNYVDTASTGFQVTAAAPADLNAVGGTYLFLAIA